MNEYKPRFTFEISEELQARANKLMSEHGQRKAIMTPVLIDILNMLEEHGQIITGVLLDEKVKPREVIPVLAKVERRVK